MSKALLPFSKERVGVRTAERGIRSLIPPSYGCGNQGQKEGRVSCKARQAWQRGQHSGRPTPRGEGVQPPFIDGNSSLAIWILILSA